MKTSEIALFTLFLVSNAIMVVMVVISGQTIPGYQFAFACNLSLFGSIFFLVCFFCIQRRANPFKAISGDARVTRILHKWAILNGICWSSNYVMLLLANPLTPGIFQIVFNEMNIILVVILSLFLNGNSFNVAQILTLVGLLLGGLLPLINGFTTGETSRVMWYIIYLIGALAIGMANTVTENVMRNVKKKTNEQSWQFLISTSQFLFLTNVYSIVIVLLLSPVAIWAYSTEGLDWTHQLIKGMACLWIGECSLEDNPTRKSNTGTGWTLALIMTWGSSTLSFVCAQIAGMLQRERDVVYVTVAYTLAPAFSTIILFMPFLGPYQEHADPFKVSSAIITLVSAFLYQVATTLKDQEDSSGLNTVQMPIIRRLLEYRISGKSAEWFRLEPVVEAEATDLNNNDSITQSILQPVRFMG